jgi:hypothetical protein
MASQEEVDKEVIYVIGERSSTYASHRRTGCSITMATSETDPPRATEHHVRDAGGHNIGAHACACYDDTRNERHGYEERDRIWAQIMTPHSLFDSEYCMYHASSVRQCRHDVGVPNVCMCVSSCSDKCTL